MDSLSGFGIGNLQDVQAINKALEGVAAGIQTGYTWGGTDQVGGGALRVESLDSSLKVITFTDKHINFWKDIPKSAAYSTVEEYNQLNTYGIQAGGFVSEGELPYNTNSDYARKAALVKFVGTQRSVSHPMTLVRTMVPDVIAQENSNGIMWMLRQIENALFWGQSKGKDSAEYVEWDGLDTLCGNTYDLKNTNFGTTPFTTIVNDLAQTVVDNFGFPTDLYIPFPILAKINEEFAGTAAQRVLLPTTSGNQQVNINIDGLMTQAGRVNLKPTFFLQKTATVPTSGQRRNAGWSPTGLPTFAMTTSTTDMTYQLADGAYTFDITLSGKFGETDPLSVTGGGSATATLATTADSFVCTFSAAPSGIANVDFINIYMSEAAGSTTYLVRKIKITDSTTAYSDNTFYNGERLPNTYTAFIGQNTPDVITFRQLAPLVKMDLATIAPAYKWMILLYGVPVIFAPLKWTRIINIKY